MRKSFPLLFLAFSGSCSLMSTSDQFTRLPDRHEFSQQERQVITQSVIDFLGFKTPPVSLLLKSHDGTLVCGLANGNRFFLGSLLQRTGGPDFEIRQVVDTGDANSHYVPNVGRLCEF